MEKNIIIKKFLAFILLVILALPASAFDIWSLDGYYDDGNESYLYIKLDNHAELLFEVNFSKGGKRFEMYGILDNKTETIYAVDENKEYEAELKIIDEDTLKVNVNSDFEQAYKGTPNGIYKKHYGK